MREQGTNAQVKKQNKKKNKKNLQDNTHRLSPFSHPVINQPPPPISPPPTICNNNTMEIEFLVQMGQSEKCGSVKNDDIFNLHLESGAGP